MSEASERTRFQPKPRQLPLTAKPSIPGTMAIPLGDGQVAYIDILDAHLVCHINWHANKCPHTTYARNNSRGTMHRLIVGAEDGVMVDHINGNGLDNRRANLRISTRQQNCANGRFLNSRSGVQAKCKRWASSIVFNKKRIHLGTYDTPEDAHRAFANAHVKFHGEWSPFFRKAVGE